MYDLVAAINGVLWGKVLVYLLLGAGVWFSIRLRLLQFVQLGHTFTLLRQSRAADASGISSFQALCTSLSARVGTGNLAGVAIAISVGGPGAVFWMWMTALLGMATAFAESTLAQVYKVRDTNKEFRGGPAYYIKMGLQQPWLATLFSLSLLFGYTLVFNATQANTIADALHHSYGVSELLSAIGITICAALVVIGGLRGIARFSEIVVPIMAMVFILIALAISLLNIDQIPGLLYQIVSSAFGWQEVGGAAIGIAMQQGITRGLYSNEAGAGSVPQAAAAASPKPNHPAVQGYVQMFGVLVDTLIICSCTAFVIMLAGQYTNIEMTGIALTQQAMTLHLGIYGGHFIAIALTAFAFTSIVGNYAYAESNLHYFGLDTKFGRLTFTLIFLAMIFIGSQLQLKLVWALADMAFGLMTVINVSAILLLTPTLLAVTQHYKASKGAEFRRTSASFQGDIEEGIWPE